MNEKLKQYEGRLAKAEKVTDRLGGLPPKMLDKSVDHCMEEAAIDMEYDEEGRKSESAFFTQEIPQRKKKKMLCGVIKVFLFFFIF